MKSIIYLLTAIIASTYAQSIPSCATTCLTNGIAATGCASSDTSCICSSSDLLPSVTPCVESNCNAADQAATIAFAQSYCASAGITLSIPAAEKESTQSSSTASTDAAAATSTTSVASPNASFITTSVTPASTTAAVPVATYTGLAAPMARPVAVGSFSLLGFGFALFALAI